MKEQTFEQIRAQYHALVSDDMPLDDMLELYRDFMTEFDWPFAMKKTLEKKIRQRVKDTGELASVPGARIEAKNGYTRQAVDTKAFIKFAGKKKYLQKFIKEVTVSPGISIKVDPVGRT